MIIKIKRYAALFLPATFLLAFYACEDVIQVELEEAENVYVVDGWISNQEGEQLVQVSRSQAYFDNQVPPGVTNAEVRVMRNDNIVLEFEHMRDGFYQMMDPLDLIGEVGDSYKLEVVIDGVTLTASTDMNRVPPIDSIDVEFRDDQPFSDDGLYANFYARDPVGEGDTYWIKTFVNGHYLDKATQLNLAYDAAFDAGGADGLIFITPIRELINRTDEDDLIFPYVSGDSIRVEIHSMSIPAFNFIEIARDQITNSSNGIFALPLANAKSNITASDGSTVLGFFNVSAVSSLEYVVEE